jgi:SPW repeat
MWRVIRTVLGKEYLEFMNAETTDTRTGAVWASTLNIIAGVWLIVSPFFLLYRSSTARIDDIVVGAVIALFGLIRALAPGSPTAWLSWLNALWGIWLIVASFVLGYLGVPRTNEIVLGIIVLVFGLWSAASSEERRRNPVVR